MLPPMTSIASRIIITALAILALSAPVASAMPLRDGGSPHQAPVQPAPPKPVAATADHGTPPLVFIVPGVVLVAMLGVAVVYARTPRRSPV